MEGSWNAANQMLNGQSAVSWHFSVLKDGTVFQHYPTTSACWHSGSPANNNKYIGIEHEGKAGEPLTESQLKSSVGLVKWLAAEEVVRDGGDELRRECGERFRILAVRGVVAFERAGHQRLIQSGLVIRGDFRGAAEVGNGNRGEEIFGVFLVNRMGGGTQAVQFLMKGADIFRITPPFQRVIKPH